MATIGRMDGRRAEVETQANDEVVENDHLRLHRRDRRTSPEVRLGKTITTGSEEDGYRIDIDDDARDEEGDECLPPQAMDGTTVAAADDATNMPSTTSRKGEGIIPTEYRYSSWVSSRRGGRHRDSRRMLS